MAEKSTPPKRRRDSSPPGELMSPRTLYKMAMADTSLDNIPSRNFAKPISRRKPQKDDEEVGTSVNHQSIHASQKQSSVGDSKLQQWFAVYGPDGSLTAELNELPKQSKSSKSSVGAMKPGPIVGRHAARQPTDDATSKAPRLDHKQKTQPHLPSLQRSTGKRQRITYEQPAYHQIHRQVYFNKLNLEPRALEIRAAWERELARMEREQILANGETIVESIEDNDGDPLLSYGSRRPIARLGSTHLVDEEGRPILPLKRHLPQHKTSTNSLTETPDDEPAEAPSTHSQPIAGAKHAPIETVDDETDYAPTPTPSLDLDDYEVDYKLLTDNELMNWRTNGFPKRALKKRGAVAGFEKTVHEGKMGLGAIKTGNERKADSNGEEAGFQPMTNDELRSGFPKEALKRGAVAGFDKTVHEGKMGLGAIKTGNEQKADSNGEEAGFQPTTNDELRNGFPKEALKRGAVAGLEKAVHEGKMGLGAIKTGNKRKADSNGEEAGFRPMMNDELVNRSTKEFRKRARRGATVAGLPSAVREREKGIGVISMGHKRKAVSVDEEVNFHLLTDDELINWRTNGFPKRACKNDLAAGLKSAVHERQMGHGKKRVRDEEELYPNLQTEDDLVGSRRNVFPKRRCKNEADNGLSVATRELAQSLRDTSHNSDVDGHEEQKLHYEQYQQSPANQEEERQRAKGMLDEAVRDHVSSTDDLPYAEKIEMAYRRWGNSYEEMRQSAYELLYDIKVRLHHREIALDKENKPSSARLAYSKALASEALDAEFLTKETQVAELLCRLFGIRNVFPKKS